MKLSKSTSLVEISRLVDAGKLEMRRPGGDYVPIRRRCADRTHGRGNITAVEIFMEAQVEASITSHQRALGYPELRLRK